MAKFDPSKAGKRWMLYALLVALLGWSAWGGVLQLPVSPLTVILFFIALYVALTATLMPAIAYLNARFGRMASKRLYERRFVRQSLLSALFLVIAAWMQMQRMLTPTLGLVLLAVFVLTESFMITREMPVKGS